MLIFRTKKERHEKDQIASTKRRASEDTQVNTKRLKTVRENMAQRRLIESNEQKEQR